MATKFESVEKISKKQIDEVDESAEERRKRNTDDILSFCRKTFVDGEEHVEMLRHQSYEDLMMMFCIYKMFCTKVVT